MIAGDLDRRGASSFRIAQCKSQSCRFRFPTSTSDDPVERCPLCDSVVELIVRPSRHQGEKSEATGSGLIVEALLDNIRSVYNVGSIFRTADGAGVRRLHLAGITPTPDHPKAAKTALGAETVVPWIYHRNGVEAAASLRRRGRQLWALEDTSKATSLFDITVPLTGSKVVLVVGNELAGVDPGILEACDKVVQIPMQGVKRSLNVAVAFGIAAYHLRFGQHERGGGTMLFEYPGKTSHEKS